MRIIPESKDAVLQIVATMLNMEHGAKIYEDGAGRPRAALGERLQPPHAPFPTAILKPKTAQGLPVTFCFKPAVGIIYYTAGMGFSLKDFAQNIFDRIRTYDSKHLCRPRAVTVTPAATIRRADGAQVQITELTGPRNHRRTPVADAERSLREIIISRRGNIEIPSEESYGAVFTWYIMNAGTIIDDAPEDLKSFNAHFAGIFYDNAGLLRFDSDMKLPAATRPAASAAVAKTPTATDAKTPTAAVAKTPAAADAKTPTAADAKMPTATDAKTPTAADAKMPTAAAAADAKTPTAAANAKTPTAAANAKKPTAAAVAKTSATTLSGVRDIDGWISSANLTFMRYGPQLEDIVDHEGFLKYDLEVLGKGSGVPGSNIVIKTPWTPRGKPPNKLAGRFARMPEELWSFNSIGNSGSDEKQKKIPCSICGLLLFGDLVLVRGGISSLIKVGVRRSGFRRIYPGEDPVTCKENLAEAICVFCYRTMSADFPIPSHLSFHKTVAPWSQAETLRLNNPLAARLIGRAEKIGIVSDELVNAAYMLTPEDGGTPRFVILGSSRPPSFAAGYPELVGLGVPIVTAYGLEG